uniref:Uncharacterized protein n=1 Tax=Anopheles minimus TaxID=112268 RepID=A0A182VTA0_9DIPT
MTETMWMLLMLLGKTLLACFLSMESHMGVVSCSSAPTRTSPNCHSIQLAREELAAAVRHMKPFWTSTGLCPPEPRNASGAFWESRDSLMNLELIASLPNHGISHVRIHWLLELLDVSKEREQFRYNFTKLDALLDHLHNIRLYPGFELMGTPNGLGQPYSSSFWVDLVQQLVTTFELYGPAGLFKSDDHHPFCWSVMKVCNSNTTQGCPFDTITFHRKGSGRWASEVLQGGRQLFEDMSKRFPHIERLKFANDEADPIAGWSTARPFQADVRYAAMLFSIVTQHWLAIATDDAFGRRLRFLSHDNAFLSYHPYVFEQRTLFARFQMNLTSPPHVQFVAKPVFSVLGMLANLAPFATPTQYMEGNFSYVVSVDKHRTYLCLMASRSNDSFPMRIKRSHFNVTLPSDMLRAVHPSFAMVRRLSYLVEAVQDGRNDPFLLWQLQGKPPFPTTEQLAAMREMQLPTVLHGGTTIVKHRSVSSTEISLSLRSPWIVSIRVCSEESTPPGRVSDVRIRNVFRDEVLIHWKLSTRKHQKHRCIQTFEVWHKSTSPNTGNGTNRSVNLQRSWCHLNASKHTPFMFYQYASNTSICAGQHVDRAIASVVGYYKVRAVDLFGRRGSFSKTVHYDGRKCKSSLKR